MVSSIWVMSVFKSWTSCGNAGRYMSVEMEANDIKALRMIRILSSWA